MRAKAHVILAAALIGVVGCGRGDPTGPGPPSPEPLPAPWAESHTIDPDDLGRLVEKPYDEVAAKLAADPSAVHRRDGIGRTLLHHAAESRKTPITRLLIQLSADVNALDASGRAPLHMAANYGNLDDMSALLAAGARTDIVDASGLTPMMWAKISRSGKQEEIISLLRRYGAAD